MTNSVAAFSGFPSQGQSWFRALAMAQNREWFQANRQGYEALWLQPMTSLLTELRAPLEKVYGRTLGPTKIFRLNRDVRFSKDKSPYKTNIAGLLPFEGFSPMEGPAALYLHLGLDEIVAFGFYALDTPALKRLRTRLVDEKTGPAIEKLVKAAGAKGLTPTSMETLKRAPPGIDPAHPRIELLRQKGLALSVTTVPAAIRSSAKMKPWLLDLAKAAAPVVKWGFSQKLA